MIRLFKIKDHRLCPACGHNRHRLVCKIRLPRWRAWLTGMHICSCAYWDAGWKEPGDD